MKTDKGRPNFSARQRLCAMVAFLLLLGLSPIAAAQSSSTPLSLLDNYFVTGGYVVGGVGLRGRGINGYATGQISIPDPEAYSPNVTPLEKKQEEVPRGADIVAAFLYWQTVESSQTIYAGQKGFFDGYAITGTILGNPNAPVAWSSGGCSGNSQGSKTIRTYRADVRPYLPLDPYGRVDANTTYTVQLADSGSNGGGAPLTLGATLVIIYRVQHSDLPLDSIVIYDGSYAPSNSASTMTERIVGFYDAAGSSTEITHIVGNGQPNKWETVSLNTTNLASIYPDEPPFPGAYYGSWDNPTWFPSSAVNTGDPEATTSVMPAATNSGCVSWGAVIFSTPVQDSDGDGLLDSWETQKGYTDVNTGDWVALPGADPIDHKDIFVEIDWLSNLDSSDGAGSYVHSHLPKQEALDMVGDAFEKQGIHIHFDVGDVYQNGDPYIIPYNSKSPYGGNAISEGLFLCNDATSPTPCAFPGVPVIGWKGGFDYIRDNATTCPPNTTSCTPSDLGNFEYGRKDSYHYVLFGHALGYPRSYWGAVGMAPNIAGAGVTTLSSIVVNNHVATVTLLTPAPTSDPSVVVKPGDATCTDANCDRVTIGGALQPGNAALNRTYKFLSAPVSTIDNKTHMWTTKFTIQTPGVANGTYDYSDEPQLGVAYGGPVSTSGHSDVGGADTAVTFGLWPADDAPGCQPDPSVPAQVYCTNQVGTITAEAGTLMHELGHSLGLTHGGTYYATQSGSTQINDGTASPSYGWNCKPNYLSVMNYLFQIRGFPDGGIDYSGQTLPDLSEQGLSESAGIGPAAHFTRWYAPPNSIDTKLQNTTGGRYATVTCDGTPLPPGTEDMVRVDGNTYGTNIDWDNDLENGETSNDTSISQDVDLNLEKTDTLQGFDDWTNLDLRQIGARGNVFGSSDGIIANYGGGIIANYGGGIIANYGGGIIANYGGGIIANYGGGIIANYGGGIIANYGGGAELDSETANSTVDPPSTVMCSNCAVSSQVLTASGKVVKLSWTAPGFGQIRKYYVWRADGSYTAAQAAQNSSAFSLIKTLNGNPPSPTYTDNKVKNKRTYTYFVADANKQGAQSGASNVITITVAY